MKIQIRCDERDLREKIILGLSLSGHICRVIEGKKDYIYKDIKYYVEFEINEKDIILVKYEEGEDLINDIKESLKKYKEKKKKGTC